MKDYQDTETGGIYSFDDGIDPFTLGYRNIPKTLTEIVIPKPDESHVWLNGNWVKDSDVPKGYKPPIFSVPAFNPAWVSFIKPYTLVFPDKEGPFEISLDQINFNSYDNEKLSSTVGALTLETGNGPSLLVSYDGVLSLPLSTEHPNDEKAVELFNRICCSILLGGIHIEALGLQDLTAGSLIDRKIFSYNVNDVTGQISRFRHKTASSTERIMLMHARKLALSELSCAYQYGLSVIKDIRNLSPSFLIHGYTGMIRHQKTGALSNLWIVVEQLTAFLWEHRFIKSPQFHPKNMTKRLSSLQNDNKTWSIFVKHELLWQIKAISDECYAALSLARKQRNDLVHQGVSPDFAIIQGLWIAIGELLGVASGVKPKIDAVFQKADIERPKLVDFKDWNELVADIPNLAKL